MVNENYANAYCIEDISKIENYDKAIADTTQTWVCHHRLEIQDEHINSLDYLKKNNLYYHRPANELIFLTRGEHTKLHNTGKHISEETRKKISKFHKGRSLTEEHRRKLSEAKKGNTNFLGRKHTSETKLKMSEANKGKTPWNKGIHHSEESRRKMSEAKKGKTWKVIDGKRVLLSKNEVNNG